MVFFSFSMAVWLLVAMIDAVSVGYCCYVVASWALCQVRLPRYAAALA
jgi:hypothetical protein